MMTPDQPTTEAKRQDAAWRAARARMKAAGKPDTGIKIMCASERTDAFVPPPRTQPRKPQIKWWFSVVSEIPSRKTSIEIIKEIQRVIAEEDGVTVSEINGPRRFDKIVNARHLAMFLALKITGQSTPFVARRFGFRDHSTVIHARDRIARLVEKDPEFCLRVNRIWKRIEAWAEPPENQP
jgi:hypothetical protein